jgi:hypothetical protein
LSLPESRVAIEQAWILPGNGRLFHKVVVQVRAKPALDLGDGHALAARVIGDLVAVDLGA